MKREFLSLNELFPRFVAAKTAEGVSESTISTYYKHWMCIGKHLDLERTFEDLIQDDINNVVVSMRRSGLAHNSISSYTRVLRTFLKWCREQGYTDVAMSPIKDIETIKEARQRTDQRYQLLFLQRNDCHLLCCISRPLSQIGLLQCQARD